MPKTTVFGQDAYPTIWNTAAVLMESLGRGRALVDGNKWLTLNVAWLFLGLNGHKLREPFNEVAAEHFVIGVVTEALELAQIVTGLL